MYRKITLLSSCRVAQILSQSDFIEDYLNLNDFRTVHNIEKKEVFRKISTILFSLMGQAYYIESSAEMSR